MKSQKKLILGSLLSIFVIILLSFAFLKDRSEPIGQEDFDKLFQNGKNFEVDDDYLYFTTNENRYKIIKDDQLLRQITAPIQIRTSYFWFWVSGIIGASLLLLGIIFYIYKREKSISKSSSSLPAQTPLLKSTDIQPIKPNQSIMLDSIAGISGVKNELQEIIDYLHNPNKYNALGLRMPKGILLVGPPGVGKTMIAKALANESKVPFFYQSGSSFAQIFVGSGAKKVQELFAQAKACKSAIIFIDEIDSVGKKRGFGRNDERESTLNQLLTEIDGFVQSSNLIVIGATNNAEVLDPALLRNGRFDRKIYIDLPTPQERIEIFELYLQNKNYDFNHHKIALECAGFSGAMIEYLINEAGLLMLREKRSAITHQDILNAKHKITLSLKKFPTLTSSQKELLSIYQGAKAVFALKHYLAFEKVALWEEECLWEIPTPLTQDQTFNLLHFYLCGYQTLLTLKNQKLTLAKDDLKKAKILANEITQEYAMGKDLFADNTQEIMTSSLTNLETFIQTHTQEIQLIAQTLFENESLSYEDIKTLL